MTAIPQGVDYYSIDKILMSREIEGKMKQIRRNVKEQLKFKHQKSLRPIPKSEIKKLGRFIAEWLRERRDGKE